MVWREVKHPGGLFSFRCPSDWVIEEGNKEYLRLLPPKPLQGFLDISLIFLDETKLQQVKSAHGVLQIALQNVDAVMSITERQPQGLWSKLRFLFVPSSKRISKIRNWVSGKTEISSCEADFGEFHWWIHVYLSGCLAVLATFYCPKKLVPQLNRQVQAIINSITVTEGPWTEITSLQQDNSMPSLKHVRERILPYLKPVSFAQTTGVVFQPFVGQLVVTYVLDAEHFVQFIKQDWLNNWQINLEELHCLAMNNFVQCKGKFEVEMEVEPDGRTLFIAVSTGDGYDATRVLLPKFYQRVFALLGENFLVAIPHSDLLVAFREDEEELVVQFARQVKEFYQTSPHPLTDQLFRYTPQGLEVVTGYGR